MKSIVLTILLALSINMATTPKAEAVVGLATGNLVLAVSGIGVTGTGLVISAGAQDGGLMFLLGAIWGTIMLDGENGQEVAFEELTDENILDAELTQAEVLAFDRNLEEINLVTNQIASELGENSTIEESQALWADYSQALDANAYNALVKLVQ